VGTQLSEKKFAAADSTMARFKKTLPAHAELPVAAGVVAAAHEEFDAADTLLRAALLRTKSPSVRAEGAGVLAGIATARGRVRDGQRWTAQTVVDPAGTPGESAERLAVALDSAWVQAYYLNDATSARATMHRALTRVPMESLAPGDRPWLSLVAIAAAMHDGAAARTYDASLEKDLPLSKLATIVGFPDAVRGLVALADNRPKDALPLLATAYKGDVAREDTGPLRAEAFDLTNQADSAIAEFELYVNTTDVLLRSRRDYLAGSYKRLGELYASKGNTAKAIENYQKFVDLWKDADPELQPAVRAARAKLDDLKRKGGKG
jgi:tetratricopeptide (TPR) repeat protein